MKGDFNMMESTGLMQEERATDSIRKQSPLQQLIQEKKRYELKLEDINNAITFLNDNPKFSTGLELLSKAIGRY